MPNLAVIGLVSGISGVALHLAFIAGYLENPWIFVLSSGCVAIIWGWLATRANPGKNLIARLALVIGILLVPAAILDAPKADLGDVRNRTARAMAESLNAAVNQFHSEYGILPEVSAHVACEGPDGVKLLKILMGTGDGEPGTKIKFLSAKEARNGKNGLQYSNEGTEPVGFYDAWGQPFVVELNHAKSDKLRFRQGDKAVDLPGRLVAVYSIGKDGKAGTDDDIKSWEN